VNKGNARMAENKLFHLELEMRLHLPLGAASADTRFGENICTCVFGIFFGIKIGLKVVLGTTIGFGCNLSS
jgi:hypothetical protein